MSKLPPDIESDDRIPLEKDLAMADDDPDLDSMQVNTFHLMQDLYQAFYEANREKMDIICDMYRTYQSNGL